jgi:hypothetical protein
VVRARGKSSRVKGTLWAEGRGAGKVLPPVTPQLSGSAPSVRPPIGKRRASWDRAGAPEFRKSGMCDQKVLWEEKRRARTQPAGPECLKKHRTAHASAARNRPQSARTAHASAERNRPQSTRTAHASAERNQPQSARTAHASAERNRPQSARTAHASAERNRPQSARTAHTSAERNRPQSARTAHASAERNRPQSARSGVPGISEDDDHRPERPQPRRSGVSPATSRRPPQYKRCQLHASATRQKGCLRRRVTGAVRRGNPDFGNVVKEWQVQARRTST